MTRPMHVLIVEDDLAVRRLVVDHLEKRSVQVTAAGTVAAALAALEHTTFDVLILDLSLPDASGLDVLKAPGVPGSSTHVIILSGAGAEADRVQALELGADDYVVKPFLLREFAARVRSSLRRARGTGDAVLSFDTLEIRLGAREVTVDGKPVAMSRREFDLLAYLASRAGQAVPREQLLRDVWQSSDEWQDTATVTEHIRRIRLKIERDPTHPRLIRGVRNVGYRLEVESPNTP